MTVVSPPPKLRLLPMDVASAAAIVQWRYEPPYDIYNMKSEFTDEGLEALLNPDFHYYAVRDERDDLIAFRCFGVDARVMGGDYREDALDMGGGLRPDLIGRGLGPKVMKVAVKFALEIFAPKAFRVTVAGWNQRALWACAKVGYRTTRTFVNPNTSVEFVILMRDAEMEIADS